MNDIAPLLKALSNTQRLAIVSLLSDRALPLARIADAAGLSPSTTAHHLRVLQHAGLIDVTPVRGDTAYRFRQQPLLDALSGLATPPAALASPAGVAADDLKVLRSFFKDGRLTMLPVQPGKRAVVLRFLAGQFELDRTYSEKEVNAIVGAYHDDYATLRRALVDARLLQREKGIYWRVGEADA